MAKRKLHLLHGTITWTLLSHTKTKEPFYYLEITSPSFLGTTTQTIYAFANLVSQGLWNDLQAKNYQGKEYRFFCEKRVRGWRLREWEEVDKPNPN